MKRENLIGLHCRTDHIMGPKGIVKDIVKFDEIGFDGKQHWAVIIEDTYDGDINKIDVTEAIFEIPYIHKWEFEYLNSRWEIDGDENFFKETLWLDAKISKHDAIEMITKKYAGNSYFTLRNMKIIDSKTQDLRLKPNERK